VAVGERRLAGEHQCLARRTRACGDRFERFARLPELDAVVARAGALEPYLPERLIKKWIARALERAAEREDGRIPSPGTRIRQAERDVARGVPAVEPGEQLQLFDLLGSAVEPGQQIRQFLARRHERRREIDRALERLHRVGRAALVAQADAAEVMC